MRALFSIDDSLFYRTVGKRLASAETAAKPARDAPGLRAVTPIAKAVASWGVDAAGVDQGAGRSAIATASPGAGRHGASQSAPECHLGTQGHRPGLKSS